MIPVAVTNVLAGIKEYLSLWP